MTKLFRDVVAETADWVRYDLPEHLIGKLWKGRYRGQEQKWFCLRLTGDASEIDITVEPREFARWQWMTSADLLEAIVPFKRPVYETVLGEFAPHLA